MPRELITVSEGQDGNQIGHRLPLLPAATPPFATLSARPCRVRLPTQPVQPRSSSGARRVQEVRLLQQVALVSAVPLHLGWAVLETKVEDIAQTGGSHPAGITPPQTCQYTPTPMLLYLTQQG